MKRILKTFSTIGETRIALFEAGRLVELHIARDWERGLPANGDTFTGRVRFIDNSLGAAFVDLANGPDGFLRFTTSPGAPRLNEGDLLDARVSRAAEKGKGPILTYTGPATQDAPGPIEQRDLLARLQRRYPDAKTQEASSLPRLSDIAVIELAIPGGGSVAIEQTRAMVAIDVDKGAQISGINTGSAAADLIAHQLRLRGLGGLVCVDFPNLRQPKKKQALAKAIAVSFADDPAKPKLAPLSRFGVLEMTRLRDTRSLDQLLLETPEETAAIEAIEDLLREAKANPGAQLVVTIPAALRPIIDTHTPAITERIGARLTIETGEHISIVADR